MTAAVPDRRTPTAIVARRARPGREREFERWVRRLVAKAAAAPGYVDAEVQPPDDLHPDEWVIVYQFADGDSLESWRNSATRQALLASGNDLVVGDAREQVVALVPETEPVTAVISVRVRPGGSADYQALHTRIVERLATFEGFVQCDLLDPVDGVQDDTVIVLAFDGRENLDRWLVSDERRLILEEMAPIVEGDRTVNVVGGFGGWFGSIGSTDVKRWKQAAAVLLALIPTSLMFTAVRLAVLPDLPVVPSVVAGNVVGIAVLTWVLMPVITRWLRGWLSR